MKVEFVSKHQWKSLVDHYPDATFFHTYEWYEVWKEYAGYNIYGAKITTDEGETLFLPYAEISKGKGTIIKIVSSPMGTYGGPLGIQKIQIPLIHNIINTLFKKSYEMVFTLNSEFDTNFVDKTFILEIEPDVSTIIKKWSKTNRKAIRKSFELPDEISFCTTESLNDWQNFYIIYSDFIKQNKKTNSSGYSWSLYKYIHEVIPESNRKLFVIKTDDKIIGGQLVFIYKNRAHYWIKTLTGRAKSMRLAPRLNYEIIQFLKSRSITQLDFGFSNNEINVEEFKKSFGTKPHLVPILRSSSLMYRIYQAYLSLRT